MKNILAQAYQNAHNCYGCPTQLILWVIPDTKAALYNSIKSVDDTE
jgi:eukaryotic translation initiation factor 2C